MKNSFITAVLLGLGLCSCTDELMTESSSVAGVDSDYYFVIGSGTDTRSVNYSSDASSKFSEGDVVGVFALSNGESVGEDNVPYKVQGSSNQYLVPVDDEKAVTQSGDYTYVFYYPYDETYTFDRIKSLSYTIKEDQSAEDGEADNTCKNYEQSDLLWDVAEEDNGKVTVEMNHAMANIILKISNELLSNNPTVCIPGTPLNITNVDLTKPYDANWTYTVPTYEWEGGATGSVVMWKYDTDDNGIITFRAAVPACRTIQKYQEYVSYSYLFSITANDRTTKYYKTSSELTLEPGKNYIFQVTSDSDDAIPLPDDEDSWVYDVYNKDGILVGLLCREYLRYQADNSTDQLTGTETLDGSRWINSQAWVLYNLQSDGKTPDLNEGQVMRFIYDIEGPEYNIWPLPHNDYRMTGYFTPRHGYTWGETSISDGITYGTEDPMSETQYYMHGGTVEWDGTNNKIANFTMPDEDQYVTNTVAELYGHITYNTETGKAEVSYVAPENDEGACSIEPRYLIDSRGDVETKYPLVKIGYNQFWMSRSLSTDMLTAGERETVELKCYNNEIDGGVTFVDGYRLDAGYIYPFLL